MLGNAPPNDALSGVLATFAGIVDEANDRNSADPPSVVVATLAERERFSRLLGELFRSGDGMLVDASECGEEVETRGDVVVENPELVAAVKDLLGAHNLRQPDDNLSLETSNGYVAIRGAHSLTAANTGQRALRQVIAALFSSELLGATLTGLVWADDSLDNAASSEVWSLLMRAGTLLSLRNGSTLVLIAGDTVIRPNTHCAGETSVRFNLHSAGVDERRPRRACEYAVEELGRFDVSDTPLTVMFLGAGTATGLGLPLGNELRNEALARQVNLPTVDTSNYDEAARDFFERLKTSEGLRKGESEAGVEGFVATLTLERVLQAEQIQEHRRDSSTIRSFRQTHDAVIQTLAAGQERGDFDNDGLVRLLKAQQRVVLVTVNFDQTIETKAAGLVRPFVTEADLAEFPAYVEEYRATGGLVPLLKLHGDIDVKDSIVANVDDTAAGLSQARIGALNWLIDQVCHQEISPWWYVGYSMRDLDLEAIWQNPFFAQKMSERWVSPFVDPSVRRFIEKCREPLWGREGRTTYNALERTITMIADDFFSAVANQVVPRWSLPN